MDFKREQIQYSGRLLFMIAIGGIGIQQICYGNFSNLIAAGWPPQITENLIIVYVFSAGLVALSLAAFIRKQINKWFIALGIALFFLDIASQVPFLYVVLPYKKTHLGVWVNVLDELALAGGAWIAASLEKGSARVYSITGPVFFSVTMGCFGCAHFLYHDATVTLVPSWIPGSSFWVYFTGTALVAAALSIVTRQLTGAASFLLGSMIFTWFWTIHLPNIIYQPAANLPNEISSALSALAFSGTAFMLAGRYLPGTKDPSSFHKASNHAKKNF